MSVWRRKALEHLPEHREMIADKKIDNPMMLWIELNDVFGLDCGKVPLPKEKLKRIWEYCSWCLRSQASDVGDAAALAFCSHLIDTKAKIAALPSIMTEKDLEGFRDLILHYHDELDFAAAKAVFRKQKV